MQTHVEEIRNLTEPLLESEGMEPVLAERLKMQSRWLVRIYMDREGGVTVDDCAQINNQLDLPIREGEWGQCGMV